MFWAIITALLAVYVFRGILHFHQNWAASRKTGLSYVLFPISDHNIALLSLLEIQFVQYALNNWIPRDLADYINNSVSKGRWTVKDRIANKHGGVYMMATPATLSCHVSDASVVSQIYTARRSFPKPVKQYEVLAMYGPNVLTCEDHQWSHHRRYTAMTFTERNNTLVWDETIRLVTEMMDHWVDQYSGSLSSEFVLPDARDDILKLTLDVICGAGFGVKLPFKPASESSTDDATGIFKDAVKPPPRYHFTFRSVMEYMSRNITSVFVARNLLPKWIPRVLLPFFQSAFDAHEDLGGYLRALLSTGGINETNSHNLLEGLVKSRRVEGEKQVKDGHAHSTHDRGLSDAEILGNLYIFTLAGHETTATTLRFALVLLALHQDTQDELYHDIREATLDEGSDPAKWDYNKVFPKLVNPLCVMLETLRLYPPVISIPKSTTNSPFSVTYHDQSYIIPPNTYVSLDLNALHYSEKYWGPDAAQFNPKRWDKRNSASYLAKNDDMEGLWGPGLEYGNIHKPVRGSFIAFSDGFRACVGKKFAQVEFVATLAAIFREYRVRLAKINEDENVDDTHRRAQRALDGSSSFLTLTMRDEVPLLFEKRGPDATP